MMKIVTLTLNPAYDVHCDCVDFKAYHENIVKVASKEAGGKGVNISRALNANGIENLAVLLLGKDNGEEFLTSLKNDGLSVATVWTDGRIRENITLHEKNKPETRISFEGFSCDNSIFEKLKEIIGVTDEQTVVTFTGSVPKGIDISEVLAFLDEMRNKGAKIVVDSRSVSLADLITLKPWLIKPNKDEAELYTGCKIQNPKDAAFLARTLCDRGISNVIISLGGNGAVMARENDLCIAQPPKVQVISTIGAGDSMLAGFIDATSKNSDEIAAFKKAVAYGTAACMQVGTRPPKPEHVKMLEKEIMLNGI